MTATQTVCSRIFVFACALTVMAFAAQRAHAGLKPEAPPHSHGGSHTVSPLHPVPGPGASEKTASTSTHVSAPTSISTTTVHRTVVAAAIVRATSGSVAVQPRQHIAARPKARHPAPAKDSGWPVGLRDAAGLNELRSVASSGGSSLLFAAGFALVLVVLAEASFLGLAGSRLGVGIPRDRSRRRAPEEPYPIRRMQLRR